MRNIPAVPVCFWDFSLYTSAVMLGNSYSVLVSVYVASVNHCLLLFVLIVGVPELSNCRPFPTCEGSLIYYVWKPDS